MIAVENRFRLRRENSRERVVPPRRMSILDDRCPRKTEDDDGDIKGKPYLYNVIHNDGEAVLAWKEEADPPAHAGDQEARNE